MTTVSWSVAKPDRVFCTTDDLNFMYFAFYMSQMFHLVWPDTSKASTFWLDARDISFRVKVKNIQGIEDAVIRIMQ